MEGEKRTEWKSKGQDGKGKNRMEEEKKGRERKE